MGNKVSNLEGALFIRLQDLQIPKVKKIRPYLKCVLMAIIGHTNKSTGQCNPSISRISEIVTGKKGQHSERQIRHNISELVDYGILIRDQTPGKKNNFRLNIPCADIPLVGGTLGTPDLRPLVCEHLDPGAGKPAKPSITISKIKEIIDFLNSECGTSFNYTTKETVALIKDLQKNGYFIDDFKAVIKNQKSEWLNNKKFRQYLRPKTLFKQDNFEGYLQNAKSNHHYVKKLSDNTGALEAYNG